MSQPINMVLTLEDNSTISLRFDNGTGRIYRQVADIDPLKANEIPFDEVAENIFVSAYKRACNYLKVQNCKSDDEVREIYLCLTVEETIKVVEAFNSVLSVLPKETPKSNTTESKPTEIIDASPKKS